MENVEIANVGIASVAAITVICYLVGLIVKAVPNMADKYIPICCGVAGAVLGLAGLYLGLPDFPAPGPCYRHCRGHRQRPCGHRYQPDGKAAKQVTSINTQKTHVCAKNAQEGEQYEHQHSV